MFGRIVASAETDKDLLGIPAEQRRKVGIDVEIHLDKVLNASIHMPRRLATNQFELVDHHLTRGLVRVGTGNIDEDHQHQDDGGGERRHGVES